MGFHVVSWVLKQSTARGLQRLVLIVLANYASDETGECWPGIDTIAKEARTSPTQVKRVLAALERDGHISRKINAAPDDRIPAGKKPNLYRLLAGGGHQSVPPWLTAPPLKVKRGGTTASERGALQVTPNNQEINQELGERLAAEAAAPLTAETRASLKAVRDQLKGRAS